MPEIETMLSDWDKQKLKRLKAFRDMWVAGTVGGFLAALMRSVPLDAGMLAKGQGLLFTFDLVLRYAYLAWFIVYFLFSNLTDEEPGKCDVVFDVIQSAVSYAAAFALGLVVHGEGYPFGRSAEAFGFANGAIFVISFLSLLIFAIRDGWKKDKQVHVLRMWGAGTGLAGCVSACIDLPSGVRLAMLTGILVVLIVILKKYGRSRTAKLTVTP